MVELDVAVKIPFFRIFFRKVSQIFEVPALYWVKSNKRLPQKNNRPKGQGEQKMKNETNNKEGKMTQEVTTPNNTNHKEKKNMAKKTKETARNTNNKTTDKKVNGTTQKVTRKPSKKAAMSESEIQTLEKTLNEKKKSVQENFKAMVNHANSAAENGYEMGKSLDAIKGCLKKLGKVTFKDYCKNEFDFSDKYGYMMINNARIQDVLEKYGMTSVKQYDHQLRALSILKKDQDIRRVWEKVSKGNKKAYPTVREINHSLMDLKLKHKKSGTAGSDKLKSMVKNLLKKDTLDGDPELAALISQLNKKLHGSANVTAA